MKASTGTSNLLGMTLEKLQEFCAAERFPRFTAKQICDWLYKKRVDNIDSMTNLSLVQRARLKEIAHIGRETPVRCQVSKDGTKKYLFSVPAQVSPAHVETVFIPDDDRATRTAKQVSAIHEGIAQHPIQFYAVYEHNIERILQRRFRPTAQLRDKVVIRRPAGKPRLVRREL